MSELLHNIALFPFWSADLTRPWWPFIPATDASPSFGYGLCVARCPPSTSRAVAAGYGEGSCVVRLTQEDEDPEEIPRAGSELRLPLTMSDLGVLFSMKAKSVSHSGAMELEGVKLGLLRLTRRPRFHGHRGAFLVDAQVVGYALGKGRSSAPSLKRGVLAVAVITLAADLRLVYPYLPSESNPADYPSRGKVRKRPKRRAAMLAKSCLDLLERAYRKAFRRRRQLQMRTV